MRANFPETNKDKSLGQWISLLNYYDNNKKDLTEDEIVDLYSQCETCRTVFNGEHRNRFDPMNEDEVSSTLYTKAHSIIKGRWSKSVTSSHSIAR
jgi:hypothetical protein